jgi:hypothetical protein
VVSSVLARYGECLVGKVPVGEPSLFSEEKCLSLYVAILAQEEKTRNAQPFPPK